MCEKCEKLLMDYAEMAKEMTKLLKENSKLKEEMARKDEKYKEQNATLNEELTKLKGQIQRENLGSQQSQNPMMENSQNNTCDDLQMREIGENDEFTAQTIMNLNNNFNSEENIACTIKREWENMEIEANCQFKMQTTSFNLMDEDEEGDERSGFTVGANFAAHNDDGLLEKIGSDNDDEEEEEEESGMDLNGISENEENPDIVGQIKCAPIKIGNILKCNWPGCEYQAKTSNSKMSVHWRKHTGERPFACKKCGQSFSQSCQLKTHMRIHTGERPFICEECGHSFKQSSQRNQHKRIHSGEKPYQCDVCGKSFRQSGTLKGHKNIHTDERPYVCEECGKTYKDPKAFKKHKWIHTGNSVPGKLNSDNRFDSAENGTIMVIVKREENAEMMTANSQMPTTSSTALKFE